MPLALVKKDEDRDAQIALSVIDDEKTPVEAAAGAMVSQLESVRAIMRAFDALETGPVHNTTPPPYPSWGPFVLKEQVGRGGFGAVCRAFDPAVDREIAVKLYTGKEHANRELPAEPKLMAKVRHPNVVTVFGAAVHEGRPGIWMEFIHGRTLGERVQSEGPVAPEEAIHIGQQLCGALEAVHAAQLVHQDIKPRNVMQEKGGRIVLMDFGAGFSRGDDDKSRERWSGTPLYMAPEVILGETPSFDSDLYSLGVLLYYMLTGTYPVYAGTLQELRKLHERQRGSGIARFVAALRELRPEVSPALARCIAKALAPSGKRYRSAAEFAAALTRVERGGVDTAQVARWAGAAALVGLVAWGAVHTLRRPEPPVTAAVPASAPAASLPAPIAPVVQPAAVEAVPATSAVAGDTYEVDASLFVRNASGRRKLQSGDRVAKGDSLVLQFEGSRPLHVYVINQDERGSSHLLFPMPDCSLQNPLSGGRHGLPGPCGGEDTSWEVSTAGGKEHFLVLASPVKLAKVEAKLAALSIPSWAAGEDSRGLGERAHLPAEPSGKVGFGELLALAESEGSPKDQARGLWSKELVLENPAP